MADSTHAPDTLFFVMEEDWRMYPEESMVEAEQVVARMLQTLPRRQPGESSESQTSLNEGGGTRNPDVNLDKVLINPHTHGGEPLAPPKGKGKGKKQKSDEPFASLDRSTFEGALGAEVPRTQKRVAGEVAQEIKDLVKMCTLAHRYKVGNLVWLSWEGANQQGHRAQPQHGCTLLGVTMTGARGLLEAITANAIQKGHWDLMLLEWLRKRGAMGELTGAEWLGSSFVWPAVGSYAEHQSGCDLGLGRRESSWKSTWVQPGTRAVGELRNRWLCGFTTSRKGNAQWLQEIFLPEKGGEDLRWFSLGTGPPPNRDPEEGDDDDGHDDRSRTRRHSVRFMQETWPSDWRTKESKRGRRNYRSKMASWVRRIFTTVLEEARTKKKRCMYMYMCM